MIDTIFRVLDWINAQFGNPTAIRAILLGFGASVGLTQLIKFGNQLQPMSDAHYRIAVRLFAFLSALGVTWALWPEPHWHGVIIGAVLGLLSPLFYMLVVRVGGHFFPWLENASGRPE